MRNRTQAARGSGFVLLWFLLATASYAWAQSEAELIAGAKKEGKVVFWSSMRIEDSRALAAGFEVRYPFIKVDIFRAGGPVNAVAGSCWIGTIERFSNSKKLSSYFGLAPRVRQSGERERHGHITKEGNRMVRSLLIQAALWHIRRGPVSSRRHYLGVCNRRGKQIA